MTRDITNGGVTFVCDTTFESWRAQTLLTKEPGTLTWLEGLQPGEVLYDVGANVGCYTLLAAKRLTHSGQVYAFEPHVATAASLLRNVVRNQFVERVTVLTCAVSHGCSFAPFYYADMLAGSSGHCLSDLYDEMPGPVGVELKATASLDTLIASGQLRLPDLVKIDIDGCELLVLKGMARLLAEEFGVPPRSIQVETSQKTRADIITFLTERGYVLSHRHRTKAGEQDVAHGRHPDAVTDNTVFQRAA